MSAHTLTLTYSGAVAPIDPYWIRIEQESASESATITDAANLLDALFDLDPCIEAEEETDTSSLSVLTALPTTDLATAIEETLDLSYCDAEADGSAVVEISIIRSHLAEPYTLRLSGGEVLETVQTDGRVSITSEIAEAITLDWPVVSGFSCTPAPLSRTGNTLTFAADQVGRSLVATYQSRWDVVSVKVFGVDGEPGECTALAFHHGVVDELQLEVPRASDADTSLCPSINWRPPSEQNQVTCYKNIVVIKKCQCSDEELERYTYEQVAPCPDRDIKCPGVLTECMHLLGTEAVVERVECASDTQIGGGSLYANQVSDPEYYQEICCQAPPGPLPACPEKRTTYQGNLDIQYGRAYWQDIYGAKARFVPVPPAGGICGEWIIRQQVTTNQCCDGVEPLAWDTSISPEVMAPTTAASIAVTGGRLPLTWSVEGTGFQFQSTGSTEAMSFAREITLSALTNACGTATITVSDGCTTVTGYVRSTAGKWVLDPDLIDVCVFSGIANGSADWGSDDTVELEIIRGPLKTVQPWTRRSFTTSGSTPRTCATMYSQRSSAANLYIAPRKSPVLCVLPALNPNQFYPSMFYDYDTICTISPPYYSYVLWAAYPIPWTTSGDYIRTYRWEC